MPAKTHGLSTSLEYRAWKSMKNRCLNPNFKQWDDYGGRGIKVCRKWLDDFPAFLADVGTRPSPGHMLDRIKNHIGYRPGNVRWVTRKDSNLNRRSVILISGMAASEKARAIGMRPHTLRLRLRKGWSLDDALNHPVRRGFHPRVSIRQG